MQFPQISQLVILLFALNAAFASNFEQGKSLNQITDNQKSALESENTSGADCYLVASEPLKPGTVPANSGYKQLLAGTDETTEAYIEHVKNEPWYLTPPACLGPHLLIVFIILYLFGILA